MRRRIHRLAIIAAVASCGAADAQSVAKTIGTAADWFGADAYPPAALRSGQQGRVVAQIAVDASGKPTACEITSSSGSADLDAGTCDIVMRRAFYEPARDRGGKAIASLAPLSVRWTLPVSTPTAETIDVAAPGLRPNNVDLTITTTVASDGTIASCAETPPSGPGHDNCAARFAIGKKVMPALTRNGRPVGARIVQRVTIQTTYDP